MNVQIIEKDGKPEWAVLPYEEFEQLIADAEMLHDIKAYDDVKRAIELGEEELVPDFVVDRLLNNENPIRVWREYREISQGELARLAEISPAYLSQLEAGKRKGTTDVLTRLAKVLDVTMDDIL